MTRLKLACATSFVSCALVVGAHVPAMAAVPMNSDPTGELDQSAGFAGNNWSFGLSGTTRATRADFPVAIAQRQVDNGWGPYETYGDDGRLTGVFIPAGGHTAVTGDTNLYPIWS